MYQTNQHMTNYRSNVPSATVFRKKKGAHFCTPCSCWWARSDLNRVPKDYESMLLRDYVKQCVTTQRVAQYQVTLYVRCTTTLLNLR